MNKLQIHWLLLVLFLLFGSTFIRSQVQSCNPSSQSVTVSEDKKAFIAGHLGIAIPTGELADQNPANPNAGLAKPGAYLGLSAGYRLHEYFGVLGIFMSQSFLMNAQSMADYMAKSDPGVSYTVEVGQGWGLVGMMAGGYGNYFLDKDKKFAIQARAAIGFGSGSSPNFSVTAAMIQNSLVLASAKAAQESQISDLGIMYTLGAGGQWFIAKRVVLSASLDFTGMGAKAYFPEVVISDDKGTEVATTSFSQEMQSLSFVGGIGFRF